MAKTHHHILQLGMALVPYKRISFRGTENNASVLPHSLFLCDRVFTSSTMNPVYSPVQPGAPYGNPKNVAYTGYPAGTPYKVPPTQSNNAPPPYSPSPNPYQTAMYPIRSAYPQQNLYAQGAYYTQPVYAAQPHVIHHTTVVQPNSIPSAIYPAPVAAPRTNGVAMGMVAGATMAMSAGTLLTTPQHTALGAHPVSVPTYRAQGTPAYSYIPPHW
ncbi:protein FAM168A isoform 4-T4 [Liasis olivaceus]